MPVRLAAVFALGTFAMTTSAQTPSQPPTKARGTQASGGASSADRNLPELTDRYFNFYFAHSPTAATQAGFHQYDTKLEDYSKTQVDEQIKGYRALRQEFEKVDAGALSPEAAADHALVVSSIDSSLLELEEIRQWQKNPDV